MIIPIQVIAWLNKQMNTVSLEGKYKPCGVNNSSKNAVPIGTPSMPAVPTNYNKYTLGQSSPLYKVTPTMPPSTYGSPAMKSRTMSFPQTIKGANVVGAQGTPSTCTTSTTNSRSEANMLTPTAPVPAPKSPHRPVVGLEPRAFVPRAVERSN